MEKEKRLKEINEELAEQNAALLCIFNENSKAHKLIKKRRELISDPKLIKWCEHKLLSIKKSINYTVKSKKKCY